MEKKKIKNFKLNYGYKNFDVFYMLMTNSAALASLCCVQHYAPYAALFLLSSSTPRVKILERQFVQSIKG